ncbi:4Fe-4S ferredoxin, nitrogenase-associated [Marinobacterium lacunae]|uniref:Ferredoxin III n=1 Tax=Marinobacterium lacunae TaxID=1232683 RepID=A0A081FVP3_9GAMM|nr:ferredoxin III, nif-specific [Marinobacterium lacunae]KEA62598.1 4Fe-4S ferredoxin, nitrogenase-associated [Marinobacterium lacunae]MBR9882895.1 ferredoxin III, nif-specific [Oceanospirillales bacterium]
MSAELITGRTRGGEPWTPSFITGLNQQTCIGCGRCYKVCPRDVFELVDRGEALADADDDYDDYDDDDEMKVMAIANGDDCIGCESCFRVCPKQCHSHEPAAA